jgi:SIR2-like protein
MTLPQDRPHVVIFAGAGASKALPDTDFPTTVEFFESLPDSIRADSFFSFVEEFLRGVKTSPTIDIEEVLLELQKLISFLRSANDNDTIVGRAVSSNLIARISGGFNFGQLYGGGMNLAQQLETLQGLINAQVYRLYSKEPTDRELGQTWNPLINRLLKSTYLDIFTTNYDLVIESSIQSLESEKSMYQYLGATGRTQRRLDLGQWSEDANRSTGLLTKLHGSLNWKLDNDNIVLGDWVFTGDHAKQAIIYPGFKGESNALFFGPFHDYLTRTLAKAEHVLVIGFAFRDDTINQIFRTSLNPASTITVMDTNPGLKAPTRRKPKRLDGFGISTVEAFLKSIG